MKFTKQGAVLVQGEGDILFLEEIGRVCYKSEDKIGCNADAEFSSTCDSICNKCLHHSSHKFVEGIRKRKHYAMLEHLHIAIRFKGGLSFRLYTESIPIQDLKHFILTEGNSDLVSGNVSGFLRLIDKHSGVPIIQAIGAVLRKAFPPLFDDTPRCNRHHQWLMGQMTVVPLDRLTLAEQIVHQTITVRFITDRGIANEIVRHRVNLAQESTRFIQYDDVEFIIPPWLDAEYLLSSNDTTTIDGPINETSIFYQICLNAETWYKNYIELGWSPGKARAVLPVALKTEVVVTATIEEWIHIFKLRALGESGKPHIQMVDLMVPTLRMMLSQYPDQFAELKDRV